MNRTMPRLGKKSLFLLCCAFALSYHSILNPNISSFSQKGKTPRNLNEGGIIDFIRVVIGPFFAALQRKFQDDDEEVQVEQISSSPTPFDVSSSPAPSDFVVNVTTNSTDDARWGWCFLGNCGGPNPNSGYLTSDVHCGRYNFWILWWHYALNSIEYEIVYEDDTEFEKGNRENMQADILGRFQHSLTEYWECRESKGFYKDFSKNMHKFPFLEAKFVQNGVHVDCYDACTDSVMCWDLIAEKENDECTNGETYQDLLMNPNAAMKPTFDYKISFDVGEDGDTEHQKYEYSVETLEANPVRRSTYGTWAKVGLGVSDINKERKNLEDLFKKWGLHEKYKKKNYNNYCLDLNKKGRDVKCSNGRVYYLDVDLGKNIGFAINNVKKFKDSLVELHIDMNAEKSFPNFDEFKKLKFLEINANEKLSGSLPGTIGGAIHLNYLFINSGGLEGPIPTELGELQDLLILDLGNNAFSGAIPDELYNMEKLEALYLHKNKFTGDISTKIGQLKKLKQISLQDNSFFHSRFPTEVNQLQDLYVFDLQRGRFSGPFPDITGLKKLKIVALNGNYFTGEIPENIGELTELEFLNLNNNNLSGTVPATLTKCKKLKELILRKNTNLELPDNLKDELESNGVQVRF